MPDLRRTTVLPRVQAWGRRMNLGTAQVIRGNARHLPLADNSVDLVVTSPPYLNLRSYQDAGAHYEGQIGSEQTPDEFLTNLLEVTAECVRVLKPTGSLFVNLGDAYSGGRRLDNEFTAQDAAWLAGVIDSDGSISIRVDNKGRSHVAWVRVGQMQPQVVERIGQVTGTGQVWQDKRGVWNWNAAAQQARWVLERVWPYLYIKRRQALAAIELMSTKEASGRKGRWNMLTEDDLRHREGIRQAVLAWNRGDTDAYDPPLPPTVDLPTSPRWLPPKSLIGIPWRYALACIDDLGLILRAEVIWSKPNGLPESVTDRVRRSHEQWFHMTLSPRYFSAVDEIREATTSNGKTWEERKADGVTWTPGIGTRGTHMEPGQVTNGNMAAHALGKLPGSVWTVPTEPLRVPDHLGIDHFAAFPTEWPKRIIAGWSPAGVCVECGEGRRPVTTTERTARTPGDVHLIGHQDPRAKAQGRQTRASVVSEHTITGYACACGIQQGDSWNPTHSQTRTSHGCGSEPTASRLASASTSTSMTPVRSLPPTRPAVVLDPFGGTGTTAMVAKALGRHGITVDMSADYCRLATWRTNDRDQLAKVLGVAKAEQQDADQMGLFDMEEPPPKVRGNAGSSLVGIARWKCLGCGGEPQNARASTCEKCGTPRGEGPDTVPVRLRDGGAA